LQARNAPVAKKPATRRLFCFYQQHKTLLITLVYLLTSLQAQALSVTDARHLLARTGFDPTWREIEPFLKLSREEAVDVIVNKASTTPHTPIPNDLLSTPEDSHELMMSRTAAERDTAQKQERARLERLQSWWINQMAKTQTPLAEQMMLFWHNHFTSSIQKVRTTRVMAQQHQTERRYALGNFADLLSAMIHDPAMLRYLDATNNRKEQPNENFARELLELFTLGIGNYSEKDIKEASRAFSGWMVNREHASFQFNAKQHDDGVKTFLGQTGNLTGDDIVRIILQQPATAEHIVRKLWLAFISETANDAQIQHIAQRWRTEHHYDMKPLLKDLFNTPDFWAQSNRGRIVKSPVDYVVGLLRVWQPASENNTQWRNSISILGQDLFNPPNVKGWEGGNDWINTNTLVAREQLMQRFLHDANGMHSKKLPETWNRATENLWKQVLLPLPPSDTPDGRPAQEIEAWLLDPVFQVK
jgi:uncharacterized protein (DUF1800 family)